MIERDIIRSESYNVQLRQFLGYNISTKTVYKTRRHPQGSLISTLDDKVRIGQDYGYFRDFNKKLSI